MLMLGTPGASRPHQPLALQLLILDFPRIKILPGREKQPGRLWLLRSHKNDGAEELGRSALAQRAMPSQAMAQLWGSPRGWNKLPGSLKSHKISQTGGPSTLGLGQVPFIQLSIHWALTPCQAESSRNSESRRRDQQLLEDVIHQWEEANQERRNELQKTGEPTQERSKGNFQEWWREVADDSCGTGLEINKLEGL